MASSVAARRQPAATISRYCPNSGVEEVAQDLVDHRLLGVEVVVQAAGQDAGRVGDVAHGRRAQPAFGEQLGGDAQQLAAPVERRLGGGAHGCWLLTETTSPVR